MQKNKKETIHFLHIGKTGGTAIKSVLCHYEETTAYSLRLHKHRVSIKDIPHGEHIVFFLRDPISRFISGFYSRQRKGKPRYTSVWSRLEEEIFSNFMTPNDLASALAERESDKHVLAIKAMESIEHLKHYKKWYIDFEYFKSRKDDILFIGFQESLNQDFEKLKKILNIPLSQTLPTDMIEAHKNPPSLNRTMDEKNILVLKEWYKDDYRFIELCKNIMNTK